MSNTPNKNGDVFPMSSIDWAIKYGGRIHKTVAEHAISLMDLPDQTKEFVAYTIPDRHIFMGTPTPSLSMPLDMIWPTEEPPVIKPFSMDRTFDKDDSVPLNHVNGPSDYVPAMLSPGESFIYPKHHDKLAAINNAERCTCDIIALMSVGCKCGQMERERNGS